MKTFTGSVVVIGALLLIGCASVRPEDYGFRRVAIAGQQQYCAPREWVVPPVVPAEAAGDPLYPMYRQFVTLPYADIPADAHAPAREVCITQAQWPQWLTVRNKWNRDWAVTPATAEVLAAQRTVGQ
jgi:hypothetical protein